MCDAHLPDGPEFAWWKKHPPKYPFGECQCGCGTGVNISHRTQAANGLIAGMPCQFISGHYHRRQTPIGTITVRKRGKGSITLVYDPSHPRAYRGWVRHSVWRASNVLGRHVHKDEDVLVAGDSVVVLAKTRRSRIRKCAKCGTPIRRALHDCLDHKASVCNECHRKHGASAAHDVAGEHHSRTALRNTDVLEMRRLRLLGVRPAVLAKRFNTTPQIASQVTRGATWKHLPQYDNPKIPTHGSDNPNAKLTDDDVMLMRIRRSNGESPTVLAKDYAISPEHVMLICKGIAWNHLPVLPVPASSSRRKLNAKKVLEIRRLHARGVHSDAIGDSLGVSTNTVRRVVRRASWANVTSGESQ